MQQSIVGSFETRAYRLLTERQREVLTLLGSRHSWSVSEVAHSLQITPAAATKLLTRLERRGFVAREVDLRDHRYVHIRLTRKALGALAALPRVDSAQQV